MTDPSVTFPPSRKVLPLSLLAREKNQYPLLDIRDPQSVRQNLVPGTGAALP
ncbi:MAG: hypothetical protein IJ246_12310 [Clostridia bacterium]|nr:hypothetical protein [Clostridia bacterium]